MAQYYSNDQEHQQNQNLSATLMDNNNNQDEIIIIASDDDDDDEEIYRFNENKDENMGGGCDHASSSNSSNDDCDCLDEMPPGFRFRPKDVELIISYLIPKIMKQKIPHHLIKEINLYKSNPFDISAKYEPLCENEWYFFTPRERKYRNGSRPNRAAEGGFWKATSRDKPVIHNGQIIGAKRTLNFYIGKQPNGEKTKWIMYEYTVDQPPRTKTSEADMRLDDWVLCKIFCKIEKEKNQVPNEVPMPIPDPPTQIKNDDNARTDNYCNAIQNSTEQISSFEGGSGSPHVSFQAGHATDTSSMDHSEFKNGFRKPFNYEKKAIHISTQRISSCEGGFHPSGSPQVSFQECQATNRSSMDHPEFNNAFQKPFYYGNSVIRNSTQQISSSESGFHPSGSPHISIQACHATDSSLMDHSEFENGFQGGLQGGPTSGGPPLFSADDAFWSNLFKDEMPSTFELDASNFLESDLNWDDFAIDYDTAAEAFTLTIKTDDPDSLSRI